MPSAASLAARSAASLAARTTARGSPETAGWFSHSQVQANKEVIDGGCQGHWQSGNVHRVWVVSAVLALAFFEIFLLLRSLLGEDEEEESDEELSSSLSRFDLDFRFRVSLA